jgi:hypothetical protein
MLSMLSMLSIFFIIQTLIYGQHFFSAVHHVVHAVHPCRPCCPFSLLFKHLFMDSTAVHPVTVPLLHIRRAACR